MIQAQTGAGPAQVQPLAPLPSVPGAGAGGASIVSGGAKAAAPGPGPIAPIGIGPATPVQGTVQLVKGRKLECLPSM